MSRSCSKWSATDMLSSAPKRKMSTVAERRSYFLILALLLFVLPLVITHMRVKQPLNLRAGECKAVRL